MKLARLLFLTIIFATIMCVAWVVAEYIIDGIVHTSKVDDIVCGLFSGLLACDVERIIWGDT
jgi:hypothetical protein